MPVASVRCGDGAAVATIAVSGGATVVVEAVIVVAVVVGCK